MRRERNFCESSKISSEKGEENTLWCGKEVHASTKHKTRLGFDVKNVEPTRKLLHSYQEPNMGLNMKVDVIASGEMIVMLL